MMSPEDGSDHSSSEGGTEGHSYHEDTEAGHSGGVLSLHRPLTGGRREEVGVVVRLLRVEIPARLVICSALRLLQLGEEEEAWRGVRCLLSD